MPFEGDEIPILSCRSLAVFKVMFDRPKDWVDVAQMVTADAINPAETAADVHGILGSDARVDRLLEWSRGGRAEGEMENMDFVRPTPDAWGSHGSVPACAVWMPRARATCVLAYGHGGDHRSRRPH